MAHNIQELPVVQEDLLVVLVAVVLMMVLVAVLGLLVLHKGEIQVALNQ